MLLLALNSCALFTQKVKLVESKDYCDIYYRLPNKSEARQDVMTIGTELLGYIKANEASYYCHCTNKDNITLEQCFSIFQK